jgi:hypothetical protein
MILSNSYTKASYHFGRQGNVFELMLISRGLVDAGADLFFQADLS